MWIMSSCVCKGLVKSQQDEEVSGPQPVLFVLGFTRNSFLPVVFFFCFCCFWFGFIFIKRVTKLVTLASWFWWPYLSVTPGHFINLLWLIIQCIRSPITFRLSFFQRAYAITLDVMVISQRLWLWRIPRRADPGERNWIKGLRLGVGFCKGLSRGFLRFEWYEFLRGDCYKKFNKWRRELY